MLIATAASPTASIARLRSPANTGTMTMAAAANKTATRASQRCLGVPGRSWGSSAAVTGHPLPSPERNALLADCNGRLRPERRSDGTTERGYGGAPAAPEGDNGRHGER